MEMILQILRAAIGDEAPEKSCSKEVARKALSVSKRK